MTPAERGKSGSVWTGGETPRPVDRCESCGRFVGRYPVGFCCDTHCARCVCTRCPGFRRPPA